MWEGAVVTEELAGGTDQDAVVDPAPQAHADAQQLASAQAGEGAVLDKHQQAFSRTRHLEKRHGQRRAGGAPMLAASVSGTL